MNRRDVLALLIAGFATPLTATAQTVSTPRRALPGEPCLTRAAAVHDALTLLVSDADLTAEWQAALLPLPVSKPWEFSYAYGTASLRDDGTLVRDVVAAVIDGWADRQPAYMDLQRYKGGMLERKLMIALGLAADRAAAAVLFDGLASDEPEFALDGVFLRALTGIDRPDAVRAKRVFRILYERALVAMHTIEPDLDGWGNESIGAMHELKNPSQDDVARFIDTYADWIESIDDQCERLAAAVARGAPAGYPQGAAFYDRADAPLAKAEGLRRGIGTASTPDAWNTASPSSRYAKAVTAAYRSIRLILNVVRGDRPPSDLAMLDA